MYDLLSIIEFKLDILIIVLLSPIFISEQFKLMISDDIVILLEYILLHVTLDIFASLI